MAIKCQPAQNRLNAETVDRIKKLLAQSMWRNTVPA
jgi:hypothetical protein